LSPITIGGLPVPGCAAAPDDELEVAALELDALELVDELLDELPQAASATAAVTAISVPRTRRI
jgi:hypothetical protein